MARHVRSSGTSAGTRPFWFARGPIRNLLGRRTELDTALSALARGLHVEVSGEPGIGKTALLRYLAHHPLAGSFPDGVVYLEVRHQCSSDLLQLILEAFYESDRICKPTEAEIRRDLLEKQALILLDDVLLGEEELEQVLDIAPRSAFVVATRTRRLSSEVRRLRLDGLPAEDALLLLEHEIERTLDATERSAAARLCAALGGHPLQVLRAAAVIRDRNIPIGEWTRDLVPGSLLSHVMAPLDEKQRRALVALAALQGVPLQVRHVSNIADVPDIEPSLVSLVRRGLVVRSHSRYRLTDGVADRLRRTQDLKPFVNRAITYFTAWAERHRRSPNVLLEESEPLLTAQQQASDTRREGEVVRLGRLIEGALVLGARWGAWAVTLERCLAAAKSIGDRPTEAWALHEIGTRALCLGETATARAVLGQALQLRQALHDDASAGASERNLGLVLAPAFDWSREPSTTPLDDLSLTLRDEIPPDTPDQQARGPGVILLIALLFAVVGGFAYWSPAARQSWRSWNLSSLGVSVRHRVDALATGTPVPSAPAGARGPGLEEPRLAPVDSALEPPVADPSREVEAETSGFDRASVLIFTARPGSIVTAGSTEVCYAVSDAVLVRIEPAVGSVLPASTLTCRRVAPSHTTTYVLTASGRDGIDVTQQLVIVVR